ncbi:helix-turn-helix transcriptional regulator [Paracoccus pantotrophus]|uniref:helix-turn-helix transcriptional regulator n=1 Tax=Paracoccus pantotrophus TaxID=82367 RepID=UPI000F42A70E|nr:helix-turn-helix transcriptional regulator [Paracoccus pantotrophus]RNI18655.1 LuxR family transcriptional regulator [Paracoccus pantotrophus]
MSGIRAIHERHEERLIDLIYAILLGERSWQDFLAEIERETPGGIAGLFHQGMEGGCAFIHNHMPERAIADYGDYYALRNPWMERAMRAPTRQSMPAHHLVPHEELLRTEFHDGFLRPLRLDTAAGLLIDMRGSCATTLTIMAPLGQSALIEAWSQSFNRISGHLQRAVAWCRRGSGLGALAELPAALSRSLDLGVLIVDANRRMLPVSPAAQLSDRIWRAVRQSPFGTVGLVDQTADDCLGEMLSRNSAARKRAEFRTTQATITMVRINRDELSELLLGPCVMLVVDPGLHGFDLEQKRDRLRLAHDLTAAEGRVLGGLLRGFNRRQIAAAAGLSHETVRTQQKALFVKTGVNSQTQLVNLAHGHPPQDRDEPGR